MSETIKSRQIPNNTINYIVFGKEKELEKLTVSGSNEQKAVQDIPSIPMEISVESHTFDIAPNGEIIRKTKDGKAIPGKVSNKKVAKVIKEGIKEER